MLYFKKDIRSCVFAGPILSQSYVAGTPLTAAMSFQEQRYLTTYLSWLKFYQSDLVFY